MPFQKSLDDDCLAVMLCHWRVHEPDWFVHPEHVSRPEHVTKTSSTKAVGMSSPHGASCCLPVSLDTRTFSTANQAPAEIIRGPPNLPRTSMS